MADRRYRPLCGAHGDPIGWVVEMAIPGDEDWSVAGIFVRDDEDLVLSELRILPNVAGPGGEAGEWSRHPVDLAALPEGGMTARLLRKVPFEALIQDGHKHLQEMAAKGPPSSWAHRLNAEPARPGRAGRGDRYYAAWASRYLAALERHPSAPIAELADKYDISRSSARDLVHKARERGLLTKRGQGRAGGALTEKGRVALEPSKKAAKKKARKR